MFKISAYQTLEHILTRNRTIALVDLKSLINYKMDTVIIIIGILVAIIAFIVLSLVAGSAFRQWDEGRVGSKNDNISGALKTLAIGAVIVIFIFLLVTKCNG